MGSWLKPAERRLTGLDPQPDLDNANVGRYLAEKGSASHFSYFFRRTPARSLFGFTEIFELRCPMSNQRNGRCQTAVSRGRKEKKMETKQKELTRTLAVAGVLTAVAVVGSTISFPVAGSKCAPVQHMVNILASVMLGPAWSVGIAFCASLLRNLMGLGSLLAFPGSMVGAFLCGLVWKRMRNLKLTCLAEALGTGILGGLAAYPVAKLLMGAEPAGLLIYVMPFLISTGAGSILAFALVTVLERGGVFRQLFAGQGR